MKFRDFYKEPKKEEFKPTEGIKEERKKEEELIQRESVSREPSVKARNLYQNCK